MAELIGELLTAVIEPFVGLIIAGIQVAGELVALVLEGIGEFFLASRERKRPE